MRWMERVKYNVKYSVALSVVTTFFSVIFFVIFSASCGAKLPREVSVHKPIAIETPLDLTAIEFVRLEDQSKVNLAQYMQSRQLKWLVLTFGSKGCGVCMEKARYLQANLVGNDYNLLGPTAKNALELVGVSTDPASSRQEVLSLVQEQGLSHLALSDPGHDIMMRYFQPAGRQFSVPLTVMLSNAGIVWRVTSSDGVSAESLIEKIAATIGVDANLPAPTTPESPGGEISRGLLARDVPNRFDQVTVQNCASRSAQPLSEILPKDGHDFRALLVHKETCSGDAVCSDARKGLLAWQSACKERWGVSCVSAELVTEQAACANDPSLFFGGQDFYETFADHFNWGYEPVDVSPGKVKLPDVKGPLTLVFDGNGRLVFSKEGAFGDELSAKMDGDGLKSLTVGPDFPLYVDNRPAKTAAAEGFSTLRHQSKFTMVMFWNTWCSSCSEEIEEWHRDPDSAYNFCKEKSDFCQVVALETGRAESGQSPSDYLSGLIQGNDDFDGWKAKNWTMSLAVEDLPLSNGQAAKGWYSGWFRAKFGASEPRTVLYDQEGKVVASWKSLPGEHGPRDAIKKLFEVEKPVENK